MVLSLIRAKKCSTRLSHELSVGMKWRCHRGRATSQALTLGVLVGGVLVEDDVDVEIRRHRLVDGAQEAEELLVPVARAALCQGGAVEPVEGGEQGGGAMAEVVVGHPLDISEAQRQQRLRAFQRLHLVH
jgi:hypothetical protein